jgi:hypothetical protein
MKNFKKILTFAIIFCISFTSIFAHRKNGAGVIFYYRTADKTFFLMAQDSARHSTMRKGFEFPCGCLEKSDNANYKNPESFLTGALREGNEELLNLPEQLCKQAGITDSMQDYIKQNGLMFLHKNQIDTNLPALINNQNALFFCDLTATNPTDLPMLIAQKRQLLQSQGYHLKRDFHAEPDSFAWVEAQEILTAATTQNQNLTTTQVVHHDTKTNKIQTETNAPIWLSGAYLGMIQDRSDALHNQQDNVVIIQNATGTYQKYDPASLTTTTLTEKPANCASSMIAVIDLLTKNHDLYESMKTIIGLDPSSKSGMTNNK